MKRVRDIKQLGGTKAIKLFPSDMIDFNLKVGDQVIIDDIVKYDAQNLIDEIDTVEEVTQKNTDENITNILAKQKNDENGT